MESNRFILLLLISSSFLAFFAEAICVPRNSTSSISSSSKSKSKSKSKCPSSSSHAKLPAPKKLSRKSPPALESPPGYVSFTTAALESPDGETPVHPSKTRSPVSLLSKSINPAVKKVCAATDYIQECEAAVGSSGATDALSALKVEMQNLRQGFQKAIEKGNAMMKDSKISPDVKSSLEVCLDVYDSGVSDLDSAFSAIQSHDVHRLRTLMSGAISFVETCEDAFAEGGVESPLKTLDDELRKVASIGMAISDIIQL